MKLFFRKSSQKRVVSPPTELYAQLVERAREPVYYRELGIADSVDGRFDLLALMLALVLLRLEQEEGMEASAVALTEIFIEEMDGHLREVGVGDVGVGKQVGKMMSALGGRLTFLREHLLESPAEDAEQGLRGPLLRNLTFVDEPDDDSVGLIAERILTHWQHLQQSDGHAVAAGKADW